MMPRLLVIGDTTLDHFLTLSPDEAEPSCNINTHECTITMPFGEKLPVSAYQPIFAGNAANAAVAAARLGLEAAIWTMLGDDLVGREAKRYLDDQRVDTTHLQLIKGEASNVSVVLRVLGERTILVYHYPRAYQLPSMDHAGWIYLTSMARRWETIIPDLVKHLDDTTVEGSRLPDGTIGSARPKLIFQPGTYQLKSGHVVARDLLHRTSIFICNKEEAADYLNHDRTAPIRELLVGLHALGPKTVVITDGTNGSYASDGRQHWFLATRSDIERVEATGAGDAYASGFMVAIAQEQDIPTAMRWGMTNAESVIGFVGAQEGILTLDQMQERLTDPKCLKAAPYSGSI